MIKLEKVSKVYADGFQALKEIDLIFEEGKINVLIGPSGCGKTTTMKMINRLAEHTSGKLTIDGKDIKEIDPIELRRRTGYVIQSIGLFPHMTIYENVASVPKLLKWDKNRINDKVDELLEMVHLDPEKYKHKYPSELSGGQQQRIGVIRALAAEPTTILMDEPFSALDPISKEKLQEELIRIQKEIKKTIIFVTHDMDEAIKIADEIILMKDGVIVQKGTPEELLTNPANEFVKQFIGQDRLRNKNKNLLPSVKEFVQSDFPTVTMQTTIKDAVETMQRNNISYLPVLNDDKRYIGVISLYKALDKSTKLVEEIIENQSPILENTKIRSVFTKIEELNPAILPVVSHAEKYLGVLDRHTLFLAMSQVIGSKSGV
ncbi:betaine/proline/choline family ABC transporter ATP-binding protein [Paenisporosarcina sp. OV554]|uniref:betaine/proline/choline family ABC transporter ATP-binding protein n=1 Tax=Paenisporosarcina sp. OV554 TaxID=2135694 RepID=UPI000D3D910E|nr:betaine/proline/choline family ABC transporter ATP-binding protein [Paenisporosarcina sp. OV554]